MWLVCRGLIIILCVLYATWIPVTSKRKSKKGSVFFTCAHFSLVLIVLSMLEVRESCDVT